MNRVYARWVPRILTAELLTKRVELSKQFIKKVNRGGIRFLDRKFQPTKAGSTTMIQKLNNSQVSGTTPR